MEQEYQDIEFRKYWEIIRKRKKSILIIFLIVFLAGLIFTILTPKTYESFVVLSKIKKPLTLDYIKITEHKNAIATQLNEQLGILPSQFDFVDLPSKNLIKIEARGKTPEEAKSITDLVAKTTVDYSEKLSTDLTSFERKRIGEIEEKLKENENYLKKLKPNEISAILIRNQQDLLKDQLADWQYKIDSKTQKLEIVSPAFMPTSPSKPNLKSNLIASFILGLFLGILWAFSMEYLKKTKVSGF